MNSDRPVKFASFAEKVAERVMQFDRLRIDLHHFDKGVNCLIGFIREEQRQAPEIIVRQVLVFLIPLSRVIASQIPSGRKQQRDRDQIPKFKFHEVLSASIEWSEL